MRAFIGVAVSLASCTPTSFDTVALGDNPEPPEIALDESVFHCVIQPKVLTAQGCATGGTGEAGGCHSARSALRLLVAPDATCADSVLLGAPSPESIENLERVRIAVGNDADSSPLYRRPVGLDSHPRAIFAADSEAAMLLRDWLNGQGSR